LRLRKSPRALPGQRERQRGSSVIRVTQRDDFAVAGVAAGSEYCGLIGFRAAVGKERFRQLAARRDRRDLLGERRLRLVRKQGRDMLKRIELLVNLGVDGLIAVSDADGDDAAEEIEVLVAI